MKSKIIAQQMIGFVLISCVILIGCKGKKTSNASDSSNTSDTLQHSKQTNKNVKVENNIPPAVNHENMVASERTDRAVAEGYQAANTLSTVVGGPVKLKRFTFNAKDIQEILDKNPNDPVDKVVLKFGLDENIAGKKKRHLIAYSMSDKTLLDEEAPNASIFDGAVNDDDPVTNSVRIDSIAADKLRILYKANALPTKDKCGATITLEGFSFDAWQIQEILKRNHTGVNSPDKVTFYLGLENPVKRWHIIAYGMKGPRLLNDVPAGASKQNTRKASIFDKADPCPPCN